MLRNRFSVVQSWKEEPWPPAECVLEDSILFLTLVLGLIQPEILLRVCEVLDNMLSARAIEAVPSVGLKVPVGRIWSPRGSN